MSETFLAAKQSFTRPELEIEQCLPWHETVFPFSVLLRHRTRNLRDKHCPTSTIHHRRPPPAAPAHGLQPVPYLCRTETSEGAGNASCLNGTTNLVVWVPASHKPPSIRNETCFPPLIVLGNSPAGLRSLSIPRAYHRKRPAGLAPAKPRRTLFLR